MSAARVEETRLEAGGSCFVGQWDVPRGLVPPLPQAVIVPPPGTDLHGERRTAGLRPLLELAVRLARAGLLTFRYAPGPRTEGVAAFRAAWDRACRADLASRQRNAALACGPEACRTAVAGLPLPAGRPRGMVLVDPPADLELSSAAGIPLVAFLAGAGAGRPDADAAAALAARAADAGATLSASVVHDLTEHLTAEADWIAGRAIVHHGLLDACATAITDLLKPSWELGVRPPGTAIGTE